MKSKATLQSFIAGLGWAVLSTTLHAADVFWDGGIVDIVTDGNGASGGTAGTWDTTLLNWDVGASPHVAWNNLNNDTAVFAGTGATVNITGTDVIVGGLTFNSAYTLNDAAAEKVVFGASGNISVTTGTTRIDSVVSETGGARTITKTGAGVLELQKANDFSGGLIISAGVVRANAGAATFGAAGTSITINGGEIHGRDTQVHQQSILLNATKTRFIKGNNGFWEFTGAVSGTGGLEVNDSGTYGARRLKFSSTSNTFTGEISMINNQALLHVNSLADTGGGDIVFDGSTAGFALGNGTASSITLSDRQIQITAGGGTNRIGNENGDVGTIFTINSDLLVTAGSGAKTLQLEGANTGNNAFNGIIANGSLDTLNVTKAGDGKWILGGPNSYNGTTTVSGGTLLINGNQSTASGAVAVNGGTLGGNGTLGGSVTVAAAGSLAPGASAGTLSIGGGFDISAQVDGGAGKLDFQLGADTASSDQIAVTGSLTTGGKLGFSDFIFTSLPGGPQNVAYTLITTGALTDGSLDGIDLSGPIGVGGTGTLSTSGNAIVLTVTGLGSGTPYENWATGGELFGDDANGDGVSNGLAFLLGASGPNDNALDLLPEVTESGGGLVLNFDMLDAASRGTATLSVEHSSDLGIGDPWEAALVPDADNTVNDVVFDIEGSGTLDVIATIPAGKAAGGKLIGRLKATE